MRDREVEAELGSLDEVAGEPVGLPLRMRRDDDAVGEEGREGIVDRLERVGIPDRPLGREAGRGLPRHAGLDPLDGVTASRVVVREPVAEAGVEGRRDDEDVDRLVAARGGEDSFVQLVALRRLVRDHEDPEAGTVDGVDVHVLLLCSK